LVPRQYAAKIAKYTEKQLQLDAAIVAVAIMAGVDFG
jgi:hypothetical protein